MDRPPRNPATERLVPRRLISFSYFQIGLMQTAAGFLAFMAVLNDFGERALKVPSQRQLARCPPLACSIAGEAVPK
jgi:hypothetical protein